jgi:hypothetical protein
LCVRKKGVRSEKVSTPFLKNMKNFYFTFGQSHIAKGGVPLKNSWVRVVAYDIEEAEAIFQEEFMKRKMFAQNHWSMVYNESNFNPSFFPEGEYHLIEAKC